MRVPPYLISHQRTHTEKSPMTAVTVGKALIIKQTLISMRESIQERSLIRVLSVENFRQTHQVAMKESI